MIYYNVSLFSSLASILDYVDVKSMFFFLTLQIYLESKMSRIKKEMKMKVESADVDDSKFQELTIDGAKIKQEILEGGKNN